MKRKLKMTNWIKPRYGSVAFLMGPGPRGESNRTHWGKVEDEGPKFLSLMGILNALFGAALLILPVVWRTSLEKPVSIWDFIYVGTVIGGTLYLIDGLRAIYLARTSTYRDGKPVKWGKP